MVPFRLLLRVRYGECDAQQVVFNARYGDYVDVAATEFYRAVFGMPNVRASAKLARVSLKDPTMASELAVVKAKLAEASRGITQLAELDLEPLLLGELLRRACAAAGARGVLAHRPTSAPSWDSTISR